MHTVYEVCRTRRRDARCDQKAKHESWFQASVPACEAIALTDCQTHEKLHPSNRTQPENFDSLHYRCLSGNEKKRNAERARVARRLHVARSALL